LGRSRQAAPLAISTTQIWEKTRRFPNSIVPPRWWARGSINRTAQGCKSAAQVTTGLADFGKQLMQVPMISLEIKLQAPRWIDADKP
jgi:hypothetical protein